MPIKYKYDHEVYIPAAVRYGYLELSEARAEYSRLRSAAVKRLQRLSGTEGERYTAFRMYGKEGFPSLPKNASASEVGRALADVHHFLQMKTSSIGAIRASQREAIKTLQSRGYDFINKGNIREFGEFMESARLQKVASDNRGGSPVIVELYETVKRLQIPPEQVQRRFGLWLSKRKELESMPTPKPGMKNTLDSLQARILIREIREKGNKPTKKKRR
jgi:hypothetical protein